MAKGKSVSSSSEPARTRQLCDYVFEDHWEDGTVHPIGITTNYPSGNDSIKAFLDANRKKLDIKGIIRIAKKMYS